jgi:hypothetical protein
MLTKLVFNKIKTVYYFSDFLMTFFFVQANLV